MPEELMENPGMTPEMFEQMKTLQAQYKKWKKGLVDTKKALFQSWRT